MSRHDEREAEAYELTDVEDLEEFEQSHKPRQRTSVDSDENDENIALLGSDGEVRRDEVVGKGSKVEQLIDSVSCKTPYELTAGGPHDRRPDAANADVPVDPVGLLLLRDRRGGVDGVLLQVERTQLLDILRYSRDIPAGPLLRERALLPSR